MSINKYYLFTTAFIIGVFKEISVTSIHPVPSLQPINSPTGSPTPLPVSLTASPTMTPTVSPTGSPTQLPVSLTASPTMTPTGSPTPLPTMTPTGSPTAIPTTLPIASPTRVPGALPSFLPTKLPSCMPTFFPTTGEISIDIHNRVNNIFNVHGMFLINNLNATDIIYNLLLIPNPTLDETQTLKMSLNYYKNGLGPNKLWLIIAIDHVQQGVEGDIRNEQIGFSEIAENFHAECIQGGDNHIVTISSALGGGNISNVIRDGANDITGIIGNQTLSAITLVNITTGVAGSISAMITSVNVAISGAIGNVASLLGNDITVSACDNANNILYTIYQTSSPPSIVDHINGIFACGKWVASSNDYYITRTNEADCVHVENNLALSTCHHYLGIHDEL